MRSSERWRASGGPPAPWPRGRRRTTHGGELSPGGSQSSAASTRPSLRAPLELDRPRSGAEFDARVGRSSGQGEPQVRRDERAQRMRNRDEELRHEVRGIEAARLGDRFAHRASAPRSLVVDLVRRRRGATPREWRTNSSSSNSARNRVSAWLTAGCVIASRVAARDRLRSSYAASNTGSRLRSTPRKLTIVHN